MSQDDDFILDVKPVEIVMFQLNMVVLSITMKNVCKLILI